MRRCKVESFAAVGIYKKVTGRNFVNYQLNGNDGKEYCQTQDCPRFIIKKEQDPFF